jgi:hypothetical protein
VKAIEKESKGLCTSVAVVANGDSNEDFAVKIGE